VTKLLHKSGMPESELGQWESDQDSRGSRGQRVTSQDDPRLDPMTCLGMTFPNDEERRKYEILKNGKEGAEKLAERLAEKLVEGLAENQKKIVMLITGNPNVSKKAMAESLGISTTAIDKNLARLKQKGILRRVGPAKGGHWEVIR
jgi:hypothetical protein